MDKETIIRELIRSRKEILDLLDGISQDRMELPGVIEQWSLKDLLVHLTRWEAECIKLLWQAKAGNQPTTVHFIPDSADAINERWFLESKSRPIDVVWKDFLTVREQTLQDQGIQRERINRPSALQVVERQGIMGVDRRRQLSA